MSFVSRLGAMAWGLAVAVGLADQASKAWIVRDFGISPGLPHPIWGPLRFTLVENSGVSFGLFQSDAPWTRWALAAFALAVAAALAVWVRRTERRVMALALGLVMGGALGNFADRVRDGIVIDFVDMTALKFPWVFNLADSAITIGVALLLLEGLFEPKPKRA